MELYKKYRPAKLQDVVGQPEAIKELESHLSSGDFPHAVLLTGGSGVGKTTTARVLGRRLGCTNAMNLVEINMASSRGIDTVREIEYRCQSPALGDGECRVWILDEYDRATKDAQSGLLKVLEDSLSHNYFFLCTTEPDGMLPTIRTRCTEIKLKSIPKKDLVTLIQRVLEKEGRELSEPILHALATEVHGSARKALVVLEQVLTRGTEEEQLKCILSGEDSGEAIEIARALMNPQTKWPGMAKVLREVEGEPEKIRHLVLSYARSILMKGEINPRAYRILDVFEPNWYDSKETGLWRCCFQIICVGN